MAGDEIDLDAPKKSPGDAWKFHWGSFSRIEHYYFTETLFKIEILGGGGARWFTEFVTWQCCLMR